jgi:septin 3/9/12
MIFASHLIDSKGRLEHDEPIGQTTEIQAVSHGQFSTNIQYTHSDCYLSVIVEHGVKLRLNIVDTPGYGDQINNRGWSVYQLVFQFFYSNNFLRTAGTLL